jgi:hypothetical protein
MGSKQGADSKDGLPHQAGSLKTIRTMTCNSRSRICVIRPGTLPKSIRKLYEKSHERRKRLSVHGKVTPLVCYRGSTCMRLFDQDAAQKACSWYHASLLAILFHGPNWESRIWLLSRGEKILAERMRKFFDCTPGADETISC